MTPNDIATSISGLKPVGGGNITASTNFTHTWTTNGSQVDDANTWD